VSYLMRFGISVTPDSGITATLCEGQESRHCARSESCQNRTFGEGDTGDTVSNGTQFTEILARIDRICLDSFLSFYQLIFPCCCVGGSV
jgi:hypothetical protein